MVNVTNKTNSIVLRESTPNVADKQKTVNIPKQDIINVVVILIKYPCFIWGEFLNTTKTLIDDIKYVIDKTNSIMARGAAPSKTDSANKLNKSKQIATISNDVLMILKNINKIPTKNNFVFVMNVFIMFFLINKLVHK